MLGILDQNPWVDMVGGRWRNKSNLRTSYDWHIRQHFETTGVVYFSKIMSN